MNSIARVSPPDQSRRQIDHLAREASALGRDIVDIAGFLDRAAAVSDGQLQDLSEARRASKEVLGSNRAVLSAVAAVDASTGSALGDVTESVTRMQDATHRTTEVAAWVTSMHESLTRAEQMLNLVEASNIEVTSIASQVNILAINAKIEAARAGDAGRGFAIVAEAIKELSRKTERAAENITRAIHDLSAWTRALAVETAKVLGDAETLIAEADGTDEALNRIAAGMHSAQEGTRRIAEAARQSEQAMQAFRPAFQRIAGAIEDSASAIRAARDKADAMVDLSERIVQGTVNAGGTSADARFIARVRDDARRLADLLSKAVDSGRLSEDALFSDDYDPIPGTDPQQYVAPFTTLTDALFPAVQEAALAFDPAIVFCAAVDRNGYLPTHNRIFSHPQGNDPIWNAAHCRNRRIFNDRVGLKAGRNTSPFLLQVYRRDMGGGEFRMMKDLSAPIEVRGRHWGGLRLAYAL